MPKIGVSGPWVAKYNNINGVTSYSNGIKLARETQFEAAPDDADDDNNFYSDNGLSETARGSSNSGTITESVDHFTQDGSKLILGVREQDIQVTVDGVEATYKELIYDNTASPGYFGHGIIIKKRKNGKDLWRAVVYVKVMFSIPPDAATTQGGTIDWQAEELTATYMVDDSGTGRWKRESTFDTEKKAIAYVQAILNIADIGTLTVTSAAGVEVGNTAITVVPSLISGNSYKYAVAPAVGLPTLGAIISDGYTAWDGVTEIAATGGMQILVVEVDAQNLAVKAGIAIVTSNE